MRLSCWASMLVSVVLLVAGCAASNYQRPRKVTDERVSTIGWNRPERWEAAGMLGGMMGQ